MGLVTAKEVAKAIKTDKYGLLGTFSGWLLMKVVKISTLNKIYNRNKHLSDLEFLNAILDEFQIKFEIPEEDLKRLPKDGAYITISNHPKMRNKCCFIIYFFLFAIGCCCIFLQQSFLVHIDSYKKNSRKYI